MVCFPNNFLVPEKNEFDVFLDKSTSCNYSPPQYLRWEIDSREVFFMCSKSGLLCRRKQHIDVNA